MEYMPVMDAQDSLSGQYEEIASIFANHEVTTVAQSTKRIETNADHAD